MQKNKLKYVITSIVLIASMFLQVAHPTITWAVNEIKEQITEEHPSEEHPPEERALEYQLPEDQIPQEQSSGEKPTDEQETEGLLIEEVLIDFVDDGEGDTSDLVVQVLDMGGSPFSNVELELVKKTPDGYKRVADIIKKTDNEGEAIFEGLFDEMTSNPEDEYGIIATGWIQTPAFEPVIWFTPLSSDSNNITISLESEYPEYPSVYRFVLNPVDEEGNPLYGDRQYVIIKGVAYDGFLNDSSYTKVIQYPGYPMPIYLPEGQYVISASFESLYGSGQEEPWPNYFISEEITIPVDIPEIPSDPTKEGYQTITIGGQNLVELTISPNPEEEFTNHDYITPAISIFPKKYNGQDGFPKDFSNPSSASIMYIQKFGENPRKVYISPGTYDIVAALSNYSSETDTITTYFLEKEVVLSEGKAETINLNDRFISTTSFVPADKTTYSIGDTIALTHEIKDSNGNRLIA